MSKSTDNPGNHVKERLAACHGLLNYDKEQYGEHIVNILVSLISSNAVSLYDLSDHVLDFIQKNADALCEEQQLQDSLAQFILPPEGAYERANEFLLTLDAVKLKALHTLAELNPYAIDHYVRPGLLNDQQGMSRLTTKYSRLRQHLSDVDAACVLHQAYDSSDERQASHTTYDIFRSYTRLLQFEPDDNLFACLASMLFNQHDNDSDLAHDLSVTQSQQNALQHDTDMANDAGAEPAPTKYRP